MSVGSVCCREVVYVGKDVSISEAAKLMRHHHIGDLVIAEKQQGKLVPLGVLTDRDLVVEVLALDVNHHNLTVADLMSTSLITVQEDEEVYKAIQHMREEGVRRILVLDNRKSLVGILSMDDLIELIAEELSDLALLISQGKRHEYRRRA